MYPGIDDGAFFMLLPGKGDLLSRVPYLEAMGPYDLLGGRRSVSVFGWMITEHSLPSSTTSNLVEICLVLYQSLPQLFHLSAPFCSLSAP